MISFTVLVGARFAQEAGEAEIAEILQALTEASAS